MDPLFEIARILDTCLTTKTLNQFLKQLPGSETLSGQEAEGIKAKLSVDLLEYAGEVVMGELKRELSPREVILIMNRVKQFMIARGLD